MAEGNAAGWPRAASPSPVAPTGRPGKARTAKRFAYRNAAISQATYLGITKLVLITCAEFADDNGIFWHSIRSLARACGLSVGATHKSVQELLRSGVLKLLRHGGPKKGSNKYQFVLLAIPAHPTVYELRPANVYHTNVHEANLGEERSFGERSVREVNGNPIQCSPGEPMHGSAFTRRTEDRELNLEDSKLNRLKTGTGRSFAHVRERPDPAEFGAEEPETLPEADEPHSDDADQHEPDQRDKLNQEAFVRDGEVMTGPILAEIYRECYRQAIGASCPWDSGDEEAAARTVARLPPDWGPEEYRGCMEGLFQSKDGRCQKKPSLALRHLQEYIHGPLNKYGAPLTDKDLTPGERAAQVTHELDELEESLRPKGRITIVGKVAACQMSFSKLTEVIIVDLVPGGRFLVEDKVQERWPLLQGMINHEVKLIYGLRGEVRSGLLSWHRANIILEISTLEEAQEEAPDVATAEPEPEIRVEVIGRVRKIEVAVLLPLTYVIKLLLVDGRALVCRQDQCAEYDKLFNIEGKVIRVSVVKDSVREIVSIEDEEHDETATRDVSANEAKAEMA